MDFDFSAFAEGIGQTTNFLQANIMRKYEEERDEQKQYRLMAYSAGLRELEAQRASDRQLFNQKAIADYTNDLNKNTVVWEENRKRAMDVYFTPELQESIEYGLASQKEDPEAYERAVFQQGILDRIHNGEVIDDEEMEAAADSGYFDTTTGIMLTAQNRNNRDYQMNIRAKEESLKYTTSLRKITDMQLAAIQQKMSAGDKLTQDEYIKMKHDLFKMKQSFMSSPAFERMNMTLSRLDLQVDPVSGRPTEAPDWSKVDAGEAIHARVIYDAWRQLEEHEDSLDVNFKLSHMAPDEQQAFLAELEKQRYVSDTISRLAAPASRGPMGSVLTGAQAERAYRQGQVGAVIEMNGMLYRVLGPEIVYAEPGLAQRQQIAPSGQPGDEEEGERWTAVDRIR